MQHKRQQTILELTRGGTTVGTLISHNPKRGGEGRGGVSSMHLFLTAAFHTVKQDCLRSTTAVRNFSWLNGELLTTLHYPHFTWAPGEDRFTTIMTLAVLLVPYGSTSLQ